MSKPLIELLFVDVYLVDIIQQWPISYNFSATFLFERFLSENKPWFGREENMNKMKKRSEKQSMTCGKVDCWIEGG